MQNRIVFVTGRKGSGKTTWAAKLARDLYLARQRVIIVDPMSGFDLPGAPRIYQTSDLQSNDLEGRSLIAVPGKDVRLPEATFLFAYTTGNLWLFVDEIDIWLPHGAPEPSLLNTIRFGRHRGISLVGISQRPANVIRDMTAQSDYIIMFQTSEPRDLEYLSGRIGRENTETIKSLPQFTPAIYSAFDGGLTESEVDFMAQ